jgi:hemoglobin-like flavoprotein
VAASATDPTPQQIAAARASFERIAALQNFFPEFYQRFFARCPEARAMFAKTDFQHQHRLLKHAISLLLIYPNHRKEPVEEPNLLTRVAERHGRGDLRVPAEMYGPFVDALVDNVRHFDPEGSAEVEAAWRATLASGVAYMQSKSETRSE